MPNKTSSTYTIPSHRYQDYQAEKDAKNLERYFQRYLSLIIQYELEQIQKELKIGKEDTLKRFIKTFKLDAFNEGIVADYINQLIEKACNEKTLKEERNRIRKKLNRLMVSPLIDIRESDYIEVPMEKFKNFYNTTYDEAKRIYKNINRYCQDMEGNDCIGRYSICKMRDACKNLIEHMGSELKIREEKQKEFLKYDNASKYRDAEMNKIFNQSSPDYHKPRKKIL